MSPLVLALVVWQAAALAPEQRSLRQAPVIEALDAAPEPFSYDGEEASLPDAVRSPVTAGAKSFGKALEKVEHYITGMDTGIAYDPGDVGSQIRQEAAATWEPVLQAQALTHERRRSLEHSEGPSPQERWAELAHAVPLEEVLFCGCSLAVVMLFDLMVLQELPETDHTHVVLLIFWMLLAAAFGTEAWFRLGPLAGIQWGTGYVMEVAYSAPHLFLFHYVFTSFDTPMRLIGKALFVVTVGGACLRVPLFLGAADALASTSALYGFGAWMIYCGMREVLGPQPGDVTRLSVVRLLKLALGDRFGEFYDEDSEAIVLVPQGEGKAQVTLLGPVILGLLLLELLGAVEPALAKAQAIPNAYLNVSSSALALLTTRALFFLVRGLFGRYAFFRQATAAALVLLGARIVLAQVVQLSATAACLMVAAFVAVSSVAAAAASAEQSKGRSAWAAPHAAAAA